MAKTVINFPRTQRSRQGDDAGHKQDKEYDLSIRSLVRLFNKKISVSLKLIAQSNYNLVGTSASACCARQEDTRGKILKKENNLLLFNT